MKKLTKLLSMLLVVAMGVAMVACGEPDTPENPQTPEQPEQPEQPDQPASTEPSVSVTPIDAGEDWLKFDVVAANLTRVFYVAIEADMFDILEDFGAEWVTTYGQYIPNGNNTTTTITFDGRVEGTEYYVYAAGIKGDKQILSERVVMTTLDKQYTTTTLPEADYCNVTLTELSTTDRYAFALTDEAADFYFTFNLYTAKGCNGAIPTGTYTVSTATASGCIELGSMTMEVYGQPYVISEGTLGVELYNDGANIRLNGDFKLVSGDSALFTYDGAVTINGIGGGDQGDDSTIEFTRINFLGTSDSEPGWYEIQFMPAEGISMLSLQFYSDPNKSYLTSGFYPVFENVGDATAMGMGSSWIYAAQDGPAGSFYEDDMKFPNMIVAGMDSYVQVNSDLSSGEDYYDISFSLKIKSVIDGSISTLVGTYKGGLGFTPTDEVPTMRMESMYVDITSEGTTHTLNFHGGFTSMVVKVEAEQLPAVGDGWVEFDIVSGNFTDAYAELSNTPITDGTIQIKHYPDAPDASDNNAVKAYYAFKLNAKIAGFDLVGEWESFYKKYDSGW